MDDTITCPTCEGTGTISMEEAIAERGDTATYDSEQEYLDELIFRAGGPSIYRRCPKDGRMCTRVDSPIAELREQAVRYRAAGMGEEWLCCRVTESTP